MVRCWESRIFQHGTEACFSCRMALIAGVHEELFFEDLWARGEGDRRGDLFPPPGRSAPFKLKRKHLRKGLQNIRGGLQWPNETHGWTCSSSRLIPFDSIFKNIDYTVMGISLIRIEQKVHFRMEGCIIKLQPVSINEVIVFLLRRGGLKLTAMMLLLFLFSSYTHAIDIQNALNVEFAWVDLGKEESRLRENHWGDRFFNGGNLQTSLYSSFSFGNSLSAVLMPTEVTTREGTDLFFRKAYLRLVLWNVAFKVGRDSLWWGPGRHGTLLVSNNAFPFDLIEIGSASPFYLPGFLSRLGQFEMDGFLTRLEEDRDFAHTRLLGVRIIYRPMEELMIGFTRMTMFGGEGRPGLTVLDFVGRYFSRANESGKFNTNELAGVDGRLLLPVGKVLPGHTMELYGEYGGEDEAGFWPTKPAFLGGVEWSYKRRRVIIEYANNHVSGFPDVWYTHTIYTSGYTYRGNIIGHHMGSDAKDLFIRTELPLQEQWAGGIDVELERHHLSAPSQEVVRRLGGDLTYSVRTGSSYSARLMYEQIENLNLLSENERNLYGILSATWQF